MSRPLFSIVSAVYDVAPYLEDFIRSIEAQEFDLTKVEVIAVDDGSTDESGRILDEWAQRRPGLVRVLHQENAGQGAARNAGTTLASGTWITFPDPDDLLDPLYLAKVARQLERHPDAVMAATKLVILTADGTHSDSHPLRWRFAKNRLVDLDARSRWFQGSAPSSFFRLDDLRRDAVQFDDRVRPNFEDGHFCTRYLLGADARLVAFVADARYYYRKQAAGGTSTLQRSRTDPGRYTSVLEHGYLDVLQHARARLGLVPEWVQNFVLYELGWYFGLSESGAAAAPLADEQVRARFADLLPRIARHLDPEIIATYSVSKYKPEWRDLLISLSTGALPPRYVVVDAVDERQRLVRYRYRFTGERPHEVVFTNGQLDSPKHAKYRRLVYFGCFELWERVAWIRGAGRVRFQLDGHLVPVRRSWPTDQDLEIDALSLVRSAPGRSSGGRRPARREALLERVAASRAARRLFGRSWVLIDRVHNSGDRAETHFWHLREHARDVNAWFVVEKGTADWRRISRRTRRVVPYGSLRWKLLMANAALLVSSHADRPIVDPPGVPHVPGRPRRRFAFLQHGVIKDDLSGWLNPKAIDLFVTSTVPEYESIVGDGSPYVFTTKEVVLTGLPRFDELFRKGQAVPVEQRDLVLVAPTWRNGLQPPLAVGSQRRAVTTQLLESEFMRTWLALLRSPDLAQQARDAGLTIGFLPHPNIAGVLDQLDLPEHVRPLTYEDDDVQMLFARAAVLVTDYSSIAFNAAFMDRPVVYFQFDAEAVQHGGHVGQKGYFSYERDGFGEVAADVPGAVEAVARVIRAGGVPSSEYQARIDATFAHRDDQASARVTDELRRLVRKGPRSRR